MIYQGFTGAYLQQENEKWKSKKFYFRIYETIRLENENERLGEPEVSSQEKNWQYFVWMRGLWVPLEGQKSFTWNMTYFIFEDGYHAVPFWDASVYLVNNFV